MMKKRFYDVLTIVYIVLVIVAFLVANHMFLNNLEKTLSGNIEGIFTPFFVARLIVYVLMIVYWLFILVLAAKLHRERLTKTVDLVVIILVVPLAPIFYLTNLRKPLKMHESHRN